MSPERHRIGLAACACALVVAAPATAAPRVAVVVQPPFPLERYAAEGAVGLVVPGSGSTVTRAGALASLLRGRVESALVGGVPGGPAEIRLARAPGTVTIHVALPPPGRTHNVVRYPIAIVGGGYHGLLRSSATRIPGLVSIADVAPTAVALAAGQPPRISSRRDPAAAADAGRLDARLAAAHAVRVPARLAYTGLLLFAFVLAFLLRSRIWARAAVLLPPFALAASLALSAAGVYGTGAVVAVICAAAVVAVAVGRLGDVATAALAVACLAAELVVLVARPEVNALAAIGPHPDGGGRYFGVTNEVEAMLLAPALFAAAVLGGAAVPAVGALALVLVGWSRAGADGGGLLVFAAAFAVLWLRLRGGRLGVRRLVVVLAGVAVVGVALVGIDAATGGSSHVTTAVGGGPGSLLGDLGHRLHVSWAGATSSWPIVVQTLAPLVAWAVFLLSRPRHAVVDAMLVGLAVSLVVNDTPQDAISTGAMCCGALWAWARLERAPRPRAREVVTITPHPRPAGRTG
ncbi:MAG TPA: hypothetical protein VFL66_03320 [Gaiellaceae bacterium]|nr:hypothetical protein [Gaiellaceae bacterium]